jgi:cyanophycinase
MELTLERSGHRHRHPAVSPLWKHGPVDITLVGGGRREELAPMLYGPFVAAAGPKAVIACVIVDGGENQVPPPWTPAGLRNAALRRSGHLLTPFERWTRILSSAGPCRTVNVSIPAGGALDVTMLEGTTGLFVAGGLTPAYAAALAPVRDEVRAWLERTAAPYAGYSAGAACAAERAIVGGWHTDGTEICPVDSAEDLDELTITRGLGLVPALIDVHCAQWGTLPRTIAAVRAEAAAGRAAEAWALDENTAVRLTGGTATVLGAGRVHRLAGDRDEVTVRVLTAGQRLRTPR